MKYWIQGKGLNAKPEIQGSTRDLITNFLARSPQSGRREMKPTKARRCHGANAHAHVLLVNCTLRDSRCLLLSIILPENLIAGTNKKIGRAGHGRNNADGYHHFKTSSLAP